MHFTNHTFKLKFFKNYRYEITISGDTIDYDQFLIILNNINILINKNTKNY